MSLYRNTLLNSATLSPLQTNTFSFNPPPISSTSRVNQAQGPFLVTTTTTQPLPAFGTDVFKQTNSTYTQAQKPVKNTTSCKMEQMDLLLKQTGVTQKIETEVNNKLSTKLNIHPELKIKVSETVNKLKEALTRVNEMAELTLKITGTNLEAKLKEVRTVLTDKWNTECIMLNAQIEKLNNKILTLQTTIERLDSNQKRGQTTTGFNTGQPSFSFKQTDTTQASNLVKLSQLKLFWWVTPLDTSTSSTSTPGVGQSTSTFGYSSQTNNSSLFSQPHISETESSKKESDDDDTLPTKFNITFQLFSIVNEVMDTLNEALKRVNEMVEMLLEVKEPIDESQIADANIEGNIKEVYTILIGKWNEECRIFNAQIKKLNKKILDLRTTIESKEMFIKDNLKKEGESVCKANSKIGPEIWKFNKQKEKTSRKNLSWGYNADTSGADTSGAEKNLNEAVDQLKEALKEANETIDSLLNGNAPIIGSPLIDIIQADIEQIKKDFNKHKQKYENLRVKYEILQQEHVTNAKLMTENITMKNQLSNTKYELQKLETELKALKKTCNEQHELNQFRFESCLEQKQSELDQLKNEIEVINDELKHMWKESEKLKVKLDGYENINEVTRSKAKSRSNEEPNQPNLRKGLMKVIHLFRFDFKMDFFVLFLSLFFFFIYYYLFLY